MIPAEREPSADMRLLERERELAGAKPPAASQWRTLDFEELPDLPMPEPPQPRGAVVALSVTAYPDRDLVPGAVITLSLALTNDGTVDARNVRIVVPPPAGLAFRSGTFEVDRRAAEDSMAFALLDGGITIDVLEPRVRRTYLARFTLGGAGGDIAVVPDVRATGAAVIGTHALRLRRSATAGAFAAQLETERSETDEAPFYELDDDEALVYEAADAALGGADPAEPAVVTTDDQLDLDREPVPEIEVVPDAPPSADDAVAAQAANAGETQQPPLPPIDDAMRADADAAESVTPARHEEAAAAPVQPEPVALGPSFAALGGPVLSVALDASRIVALARLFTGDRSLGMIAHYLLLNALAAVEPLDADSGYDGSLATFAAEQERLLSRALIAIKLGRDVAPAAVAAPLPAFPPPSAPFEGAVAIVRVAREGSLVLYRPFRDSEIAFLKRTIENEDTATFMRAAQLFVGSCATGLAVPVSTERRACERELGEYASAATSEINRLFVRARLTRRSELFTPTAREFDDRARRLLGALAAFAH